jgi:hypothetical protein
MEPTKADLSPVRLKPDGPEAPKEQRGARATAAAIRVLLIEDSEDDAALSLRQLRIEGYAPQSQRVESADALRAAGGAGLGRHPL